MKLDGCGLALKRGDQLGGLLRSIRCVFVILCNAGERDLYGVLRVHNGNRSVIPRHDRIGDSILVFQPVALDLQAIPVRAVIVASVEFPDRICAVERDIAVAIGIQTSRDRQCNAGRLMLDDDLAFAPSQ